MDIINIGDKVKFAENQFVVTDIDRLSQPVPYYKLVSLDGDKSKTIWSNGVSLKKIVTPGEVIGNGEQITFDVQSNLSIFIQINQLTIDKKHFVSHKLCTLVSGKIISATKSCRTALVLL